jgi:hypothetical protein
LLDKQEIYETLARYCRGVDRGDEQEIRGVFHRDSIVDDGAFKGNGWENATRLAAAAGDSKAMTHNLTNVLVTVSGDSASSEACVIAHRIFEQDGQPLCREFFGRYLDSWTRRDGTWRISERVVVHDWSDTRPVTEAAEIARNFVLGGRFPDDPSYAIRQGQLISNGPSLKRAPE